MTDPELIAAVDALTKPHVLARYVGTTHDHEWKAVTRAPTREEVAQWEREKKPRRRKIETGEFWCRHCDTVVEERPEPEDTTRIDRKDDAPLLEQLEEAVASNIGGTGVGKPVSTRTPFDVGAFQLYGEIDERVRAWIIDLGGTPGKGLTLGQLVRAWFNLRIGGVHPEGEDARYTAVLARWKTSILDIIDPPEQIPYRGQPCPICGETRALVWGAGEVEDTVALWAFLRPEYRDEGSYGLCRACKTVLARDTDPIRLRARMNGTSSPRLTQTISDSV